MNWDDFFEKTRCAAGVDSFAKLAPLLHVSDGAISHYRTGKRAPNAWTVAAALKIQGHPEPEREAARLMRETSKSAEERAFWRKLSAAAAIAAVALLPIGQVNAKPLMQLENSHTLTGERAIHYAKSWIRRRIRELLRVGIFRPALAA